MIYELFRLFGVTTGFPFDWIFFKRKMFYESDAARKSHRYKKGALIIQNHYNIWDYIMTTFIVYPRRLHVVASEMAFGNSFMRFLMRFWGGIEANRITKSMHFIVESAKLIKKDKIVLIFPEGHNTEDGNIHEFYESYLLIALRAKAPIIPIVSDGSYSLFKRTHVMIGEMIHLSDYLESERYTREDLDRLNEIVYQKMLSLKEELDRRKGKA